MPDKQNDNKFMAMLERRGIVRKADQEDDLNGAESDAEQARPELDFRTSSIAPNGESTRATPAARQPIPGFASPIIPGEKPTQAPAQNQPAEEKAGAAQPVHQIERVTHEPPKPVEAANPTERYKPAEVISPLPLIGVDSLKDEAMAEDVPNTAPAATVSYAQPTEQPPQENYSERYLEIDELYEVLSMRSKKTDTIYLIEEYLRTLPDSLPDESRREIVGKIVSASGFDYDHLMGDGVLRVKMLKEYAERFARFTEDYVAARHAELNELEQQSLRIRKLIENRRELHKRQFFAIDAEAQRLKDILTFISG